MADRTAVSVTDLVKIYADRKEGVRAVDGVSFEVREGEFYTLLGPSGCGKTTTLRCVAGLERTDSGTITVDNRVVSSHSPNVFVPPHKRDIGMVFQSYAIWPHMTVFENVAFPLRVGKNKVSKGEISRRVEEALTLVELGGYGGRLATQLSGGQQQRLALARALVREPKLLLLDEPLSNLDAQLREHMRAELRDLQRRLGLTTIYVTHDQIEALSMSNRIALMSNGHIVQEGRPRELYQKPASQFVASFLGSTNLLEATVAGPADGMWALDTPAGQLKAACPTGVQAGDKVTVSIRPESLSIKNHSQGGGNVLQGQIDMFMFLGEMAECRVRVGGSVLRSRQHPNVSFSHGETVYVHMPVESCTVISDEHGVAAPEYREEAEAVPA
ncbi:MAG: ABC transporter ATP-binding protein [Chloroflexi bacterium]|nr:ABC transporter ATP-binding protein [Chloroflexota bacterium]